MPSLTQGTRPISGVYVRGRLATGLYVGQQAIWPTEILGASSIGVGTFGLRARGLLAETGNSIRVAPRTFTFTGRPLQSAISRALRVDLQRGAATIMGRGAGVAADAKPPLHAGALPLSNAALAVVSGHVIPAITGSLHFAGQPLPKISGNEVAAYLSPGTLQFAAVNVAAAIGATNAVGAGGFAFAGTAPSVGAGSALAVALAPSDVALTGRAPSIGAATAINVGEGTFAFEGEVLFPPADVVVSVTPSALSMWGHYTDVDTSPFALRRVGTRSTIGVTGGGNTNVLLPPGAKAGDLALLASYGPQSSPYGGPAGSDTIENQQLALYRYTLTLADALNGYVVMGVGGPYPITAEVFHDADPVLDAVGTYSQSTVAWPAPTGVTFSGVTTTRAGAEPVGFLAATYAGSTNLSTPSPATWGVDGWSAGIGVIRGPAQAPGAVADVTWGYNYSTSQVSSSRGAVMLAVRPAAVNVFAELSPGALALPSVALTVPWTYPDVSLPLLPDVLALSGPVLVEPMDVPTVTFVGSDVAYNAHTADNGSLTHLPLPAGTQAGDYMFANFGMNGFNPNDPPRVPPDSQLFRTVGKWFSLTAYWIPITAWDVANGYITVDPRGPCSFPYVVYRGADRYLQAVGTIVTPDPNVQQNGTLLVPGLAALQASGAAIIALTTTDTVNSEVAGGSGEWGVSAAAPWEAESATIALLQVGGGGLRSAVLWRPAEVGAGVPDTLVNEFVWSQYSDYTAAQMFAMRSHVTNTALNAVPSAMNFVGAQPAVNLKADIAALAGVGELTLAGAQLGVLALNQLQITTASIDIPTGASGTIQMQATGGLAPYAWSVDAGTPLPSGVTMNASGLISYDGTQTATTTNVTFTVVDSRSTEISATISVSVAAPPAAVWDAAKIPSNITRTSDTVVTCNATPTPPPSSFSTCAATVGHSVGKWLFALSTTGSNPVFGAVAAAPGSGDPWINGQYIGIAGGVGEGVGFDYSNMQAYWNSQALGVHSVTGRVAFTDFNAWIIAVDLDSDPQTIALYDDTKLLNKVTLPSGARGWEWFPACSMATVGVKVTLNAGQSAITVPPPLAGLGFVSWNSAPSSVKAVAAAIAPGHLVFAGVALAEKADTQLSAAHGTLAYDGRMLVEAVGDISVAIGASHLTMSGALPAVATGVSAAIGAGALAITTQALAADVQAATTTPTLINVGSSANSGTTVNLSVPITVAAGDTILAVLSARQGATNTGPAGFTLVDDYIAVSSTSMSELLVYRKTADGTETSVGASSNRSFGSAALQVWKVPGGANIQVFQGGRGGSGAVTAWSVGPFTPAADNSIVIAMWSSGAQLAEGTYGVDAGWDAMTVVDTATGSNLGLASLGWTKQQQTTKTAATANFTASGGVNNPTDYMIAVSK